MKDQLGWNGTSLAEANGAHGLPVPNFLQGYGFVLTSAISNNSQNFSDKPIFSTHGAIVADMSKDKSNWNLWFKGDSVSDDAFVSRGQVTERLRYSALKQGYPLYIPL